MGREDGGQFEKLDEKMELEKFHNKVKRKFGELL